MPPRVAATFGLADFVAAEDTRVTLRLLNHLGLKKPMVSYYEHALHHGEAILNRIEAGENCALCSDAGMLHQRPRRADRPRGPRARHQGRAHPGGIGLRHGAGGQRPAHGPLCVRGFCPSPSGTAANGWHFCRTRPAR